MSLTFSCLQAMKKMMGGVPPCPLEVHQGVVGFEILGIDESCKCPTLPKEWLQLSSPGVTGCMKGTGMYLAKRGSDEIIVLSNKYVT